MIDGLLGLRTFLGLRCLLRCLSSLLRRLALLSLCDSCNSTGVIAVLFERKVGHPALAVTTTPSFYGLLLFGVSVAILENIRAIGN
jgi:hypothetical protein